MYDVEPTMWIRVATMHFSGRAVGWLQSLGRRIRQMSWAAFCAHIQDHFGREQHESLIRQLFRIRQLGTVAEYIEQISALVDYLSAYETNTYPLYCTMCFIDGLRSDIKSVIMVHRPSTLDTACALALVREEAANAGQWTVEDPFNKPSLKSSTGPTKWDKGKDTTKSSVPDKWVASDKLDSLRRYRRARGLCDKCAEKWSFGYKCAAAAQIHAMEEVWELLS